jgi:hypothetical protein
MKNKTFLNNLINTHAKFYIVGIVLFALIGIANVYAQDKETRSLGNFSSISFEGAYDILLKEGSNTSIEIVSGDEILAKDIITEIKNDRLYVRLKDNKGKNSNWKMNGKNDMPKITLTYQNLESIDNSGMINLKVDNKLKANKFSLSASGAGNFEVDFEVNSLVVDMSGAMNLKFSGVATEQKYELSGAGSIEAYSLIGDKVTIDMSGAGSAKVHAKKSIDAEISGVGSIRYKGNPDKVRAENGILGSIKAE